MSFEPAPWRTATLLLLLAVAFATFAGVVTLGSIAVWRYITTELPYPYTDPEPPVATVSE